MNKGRNKTAWLARAAILVSAGLPMLAFAQTPVDDNGAPLGAYEPSLASVEPVVGGEDIPLLTATELEDLVGPIALYPDELLAIVLPAAAYPLQIVEAARFLDELKGDPSLKPDSEWDDSVVALLNYPEIIEHLNEDIDWTWRLGEAVVAQQTDVVAAVERFRDRAYAAGNLKSDSYQNVTREDGIIEISPVSDDVIYVPYYEPERVIVYQPRPVYYYYPRAYPVYYYPYSAGYHFDTGFFWGVTTAFTIGWLTDSLHVYHHSYHGHPYYGWSYRDRWWYRRPPISVYNTTYVQNTNVTVNRYYEGDRWRPRHDRVRHLRDERIVRNWYHGSGQTSNEQRSRHVRREQPRIEQPRVREPITFRERPRRDETTTYRKQERQTPVVSHDRGQQRRTTVARTQRPGTESIRRQLTRPETATRQRPERREPGSQAQRREQPALQRSQNRPAQVTTRTEGRRSEPRSDQRRRSEPQARQQQRPARVAPPRSDNRRSEPRVRQENRRSESRQRPERRENRRDDRRAREN